MRRPADVGTGRRVKTVSMLAILVGSGLALLAATQTWYRLRLTAGANHTGAVTVQGSSAAPALTALALAGLALVAALAIAGRAIRYVLAALGLVIGAGLGLSALTAVDDPVQAAAPAITAATGVAGGSSVAHLVSRVDGSVWPWFAIAGGAIIVLGALVVLASAARWPGPSKRYQAVRFEASTGPDAPDAAERTEPAEQTESAEPATPTTPRDAAIDSWDELSRGEDPTRERRSLD